MATADEYAAWIVKNADKKGTPEFNTVAAAYKVALSPPSAPAVAVTPAPQSSNWADAWDGTKNLGLGLVKGVLAPIDGGAQLLGKGLSAATHWAAPNSAADTWMRGEADRVSNINTDREKKYQDMTPGSFMAGLGNVVGNVALPLPGASIAKGTGMAAKLASALKSGTIIGAAQPVYNAATPTAQDQVTGNQPVDYWNEKAKQIGIGAALGGALSGAGSLFGTVKKAVQPLVSPSSTVGDILLGGLKKSSENPIPVEQVINGGAGDISNLMGSRAPAEVLARLRAVKPLVPDSLPTTAQVAGVPELVMAEKTLKNNPASIGPFIDRATANNSARLAELLRVGQTPAALDEAIAARAKQSAPMYEAARAATLPINEEMVQLLLKPSMNQALARGQKLAAENGENVALGEALAAAPASQKASTILGADGKPFISQVAEQPGQAGTMPGATLQYLKMGLDDLQTVGEARGMGAHESKALLDTHEALQKWIDVNSPEFAAANKVYAETSVPVDTMKAAQGMHSAMTTGAQNTAGDSTLTLAQYRTQLAKALKNSPYGIDPIEQKSLEAIQSDLQRETVSNSIKFGGSDTKFNLEAPNWLAGKLYGRELDGKSLIPQVLGAVGGFFNPVLGAYGGKVAAEKMGQFVGTRVNAEFQKAMLDPQHFAKLLGEALDRQSSDPTLLKKLAPAGTRAATVGTENLAAP